MALNNRRSQINGTLCNKYFKIIFKGHDFCNLYLQKKHTHMKHTLLVFTLFTALVASNAAQAQIPGVSKVTKALPKVTVGLKLGANFQDLNSKYRHEYQVHHEYGIV